MPELELKVDSMDNVLTLFGGFDENIKRIENAFKVTIVVRDNIFKINGAEKDIALAKQAIDSILSFIDTGGEITDQTIGYIISVVSDGNKINGSDLNSGFVCLTAKGKPIRPKTLGQKNYINAVSKNTVNIAIGPAGTGKTYLAVAMAVKAYREKQVSRILLTRPAVEAGEKLGFLPGDLQSKVDPYLRPLYDALFEMLGGENFAKHLERGNIEIAPLAYMRGRTLDDSFIILDEAQNTSPEQMKMFLTRLGYGSKMVITGDITQTDLADSKRSGLIHATKVIAGIDDISVTRLTSRDVVRHRLVGEIVKAYERFSKKTKK